MTGTSVVPVTVDGGVGGVLVDPGGDVGLAGTVDAATVVVVGVGVGDADVTAALADGGGVLDVPLACGAELGGPDVAGSVSSPLHAASEVIVATASAVALRRTVDR